MHFEADAPRAASNLVAGRLCAFEQKTHATDKLRFARARLGSIFLNRSEPRLCLFFFPHFGPTSVPTYRSQMSRSFDSDSG